MFEKLEVKERGLSGGGGKGFKSCFWVCKFAV